MAFGVEASTPELTGALEYRRATRLPRRLVARWDSYRRVQWPTRDESQTESSLGPSREEVGLDLAACLSIEWTVAHPPVNERPRR